MRFYLLGIAGTAMASLAVLLKEKGHRVWGTDSGIYPPMSEFLARHNIRVWQGYRKEHLKEEFDVVVIGNVLSRGNEEVEEILNRRLPFVSLPELIRHEFVNKYKSIVVSGTHGKTSTTALLSWMFEVAGLAPTFLIGGIANNFSSSVGLGEGDYFIIEGDEYDSAFFDKRPKFLHYFPFYLIINNIEFDHADIYQSLSEIKAGFKKMIRTVPGNGLIVANGDNAAVRDVLKEKYSRLQYFGKSGKNDWSFAVLKMDDLGTEFLLKNNVKAIGEFRLSQHGEHQIQNAVAAIAVARDAGIGWKAIRQALGSFEGVKRRLEHWGIFQGARIYDDFAHHPTAILQNLKTLKKMHPNKRIFALFEPRTNTTTRNIFQNELTDALSVADGVFLTPVHRPERFPPGERLSVPALVEALRKRGKLVIRVKEYSQLIPALSEILTDNDVMVIMTNGNLGGQYEQIRELVKNENNDG